MAGDAPFSRRKKRRISRIVPGFLRFLHAFLHQRAIGIKKQRITIRVRRFDHMVKRCHPDLNWGIKVLQTFALPLGHGTKKWSGRRDSDPRHPPWQGGTLPAELLPQMCLGAESNHRHADFQSTALPTELPRHNGDPDGARTHDLQRDRLAL